MKKQTLKQKLYNSYLTGINEGRARAKNDLQREVKLAYEKGQEDVSFRNKSLESLCVSAAQAIEATARAIIAVTNQKI